MYSFLIRCRYLSRALCLYSLALCDWFENYLSRSLYSACLFQDLGIMLPIWNMAMSRFWIYNGCTTSFYAFVKGLFRSLTVRSHDCHSFVIFLFSFGMSHVHILWWLLCLLWYFDSAFIELFGVLSEMYPYIYMVFFGVLSELRAMENLADSSCLPFFTF